MPEATPATPPAPAPAAAPATPPAPAAPPAPTDAMQQLIARETQARRLIDDAKAEQARAAAAKAEVDRLVAQRAAEDRAFADARAAIAAGKKLDAAKALGITYDDLTNERLALLEADKAPATRQDLAAIRAEFERQMNADKTAREAQEAQARQRYVETQKEAAAREAAEFLEAHADEYPLTAELDGGSVLYAVIEKDFEDRATRNEDGTVRSYPDKPLTLAEAAKKHEAERLAQFSKAESRKAKATAPAAPSVPDSKAPPAAPATPAAAAPAVPAKPAPGITSDLNGSTAAAAPVYRSEAERMAAATAAGEAARAARLKK